MHSVLEGTKSKELQLMFCSVIDPVLVWERIQAEVTRDQFYMTLPLSLIILKTSYFYSDFGKSHPKRVRVLSVTPPIALAILSTPGVGLAERMRVKERNPC